MVIKMDMNLNLYWMFSYEAVVDIPDLSISSNRCIFSRDGNFIAVGLEHEYASLGSNGILVLNSNDGSVQSLWYAFDTSTVSIFNNLTGSILRLLQ